LGVWYVYVCVGSGVCGLCLCGMYVWCVCGVCVVSVVCVCGMCGN